MKRLNTTHCLNVYVKQSGNYLNVTEQIWPFPTPLKACEKKSIILSHQTVDMANVLVTILWSC